MSELLAGQPERADAAALRELLLGWYRVAKRPLPWRETTDAYAIWVSEVMLQQTRVETVIPYYQAFLARFPDVFSLASAAEDEVLSRWSGLGYYRRARLLHSGARELVARYEGRMPRDPRERRTLPGIGPYTAGAIGSIALGLEEPLVDGNVARVLSRLDGLDTSLVSPEARRALWTRAAELVHGEAPGDLNQALMELGATVCVPKAPRCHDCPVVSSCVASRTGRTAELPVKAVKRAPRTVDEVALCAGDGERVVLMRQESRGLFGGLWQLPRADGHGVESARIAAQAAHCPAGEAPVRVGTTERVLTHRRIRVEIWAARLPATLPPGARAMGSAERRAVGISTFTQSILELADYRASPHRQSSHSRVSTPRRRKDSRR